MAEILKTVLIESLVAPNIANLTNVYGVLCSGCLYFFENGVRKFCNVNTPASVSWRCVSPGEEALFKNTLMDYFPIEENDPSSDGSFIIYSKIVKQPTIYDGFHNVKFQLEPLGKKFTNRNPIEPETNKVISEINSRTNDVLNYYYRFWPPKEDHMPSLRYAFVHSGISYSDKTLENLELEN